MEIYLYDGCGRFNGCEKLIKKLSHGISCNTPKNEDNGMILNFDGSNLAMLKKRFDILEEDAKTNEYKTHVDCLDMKISNRYLKVGTLPNTWFISVLPNIHYYQMKVIGEIFEITERSANEPKEGAKLFALYNAVKRKEYNHLEPNNPLHLYCAYEHCPEEVYNKLIVFAEKKMFTFNKNLLIEYPEFKKLPSKFFK